MDIPMYREEKKEHQFEQIQEVILKKTIFRTDDAKKLNIDYRRIKGFVEEGRLRKIKSGYYTDDGLITEDKLIGALFPDGVLTMESALYIYGYLKEKPKVFKVAIDKNTSKSRFNIEYPWIEPYYTEKDVLNMGRKEIELEGQKIGIYEKERLIADILKYQHKMERHDFREAIFSYIDDEKKDMSLLMKYATKRNVMKKVHDIIGVWLE